MTADKSHVISDISSNRIEVDSADPGWVGAWWIGLIYSGIAAMTVAALMACFPRELPSISATSYLILKSFMDTVYMNMKCFYQDHFLIFLTCLCLFYRCAEVPF